MHVRKLHSSTWKLLKLYKSKQCNATTYVLQDICITCMSVHIHVYVYYMC